MDKANNNFGNMNIFESEEFTTPKPVYGSNFVSPVSLPEDAMSQFAEALYNLQSEIDLIKNKLAENKASNRPMGDLNANIAPQPKPTFDIAETLTDNSETKEKLSRIDEEIEKLNETLRSAKIEDSADNAEISALREEIKLLSDSVRGDMYDLNTKLENLASSENSKTYALVEDAVKNAINSDDSPIITLIAQVIESMERKFDDKFADVLIGLNELKKLKAPEPTLDLGKIIGERFDAIEQKLNIVGGESKSDESILDRLTAIEEKLNDFGNTSKPTLSDEKLDELIKKLDEISNYQRSMVFTGTSDSVDEDRIADKIAAKNAEALTEIDDKLDVVRNEIDVFKANAEEKAEEEVTSLKLMLEKIYNQVSTLMEDNRDKIKGISDDLVRFKDNFTTVTGEGVTESDDLKHSFESLKSELDNLSKLIEDQNAETKEPADKVPSAVLNLSDDISKLAGEILDNKSDEPNEENN